MKMTESGYNLVQSFLFLGEFVGMFLARCLPSSGKNSQKLRVFELPAQVWRSQSYWRQFQLPNE